MAKLRVVFMGTPDFAVPCLEMLVTENYDIAAVVTQPDRPRGRGQKLTFSPVKECALKYGLKIVQPEKIKHPESLAEVQALAPDIVVVVAFGQLLSPALLDTPPLGCINVHASLLPRYRGAAPIHWAVINGETVSGVTTMYMDAGMDTGDMILKAALPIGEDETTGELYERLKTAGAALLSQTLALIEKNQVPRIAQPHAEATYAPLLTRQLEKVDWLKSATEVHNLVRGLNPWPGAYCQHRNKILKIWKTKVQEADTGQHQPGRIADIGADRIIVETAHGQLALLEVQPESKKRMNAGEYARGCQLTVGEILA